MQPVTFATSPWLEANHILIHTQGEDTAHKCEPPVWGNDGGNLQSLPMTVCLHSFKYYGLWYLTVSCAVKITNINSVNT